MKPEEEKQLAAQKAVEFIASGMVVGLGSGSTASHAIRFLGQAIRAGQLRDITGVATSLRSEKLAESEGIPLMDVNAIEAIDIAIDGADEFDPYLNLIKGGGGALVREKIIAFLSKVFIVIVDSQKAVSQLGNFPLPVELLPFSSKAIVEQLEQLGLDPVLRLGANGQAFLSDNGNFIVDLHLERIPNPVELNQLLTSIPGIVDNGLFIDYADKVIMGAQGQVFIYER